MKQQVVSRYDEAEATHVVKLGPKERVGSEAETPLSKTDGSTSLAAIDAHGQWSSNQVYGEDTWLELEHCVRRLYRDHSFQDNIRKQELGRGGYCIVNTYDDGEGVRKAVKTNTIHAKLGSENEEQYLARMAWASKSIMRESAMMEFLRQTSSKYTKCTSERMESTNQS